MNYKIIGGDQKEYGPINAEQMLQWISEGRLNAQSMAQAEGGAGWQPLSSFPEFGLQAPAVSAPAALVKPPAAIKVFGIINIVWGSLALFCTPLSLLSMRFAAQQPGYQPVVIPQDRLVLGMTIAVVGGAIMLASGIGLCRMKSWARRLAVYYAGFEIAWSIINIILSAKSDAMQSVPEQFRALGIIVAVLILMVAWTYNGLLIFFLSKREVKTALGETP